MQTFATKIAVTKLFIVAINCGRREIFKIVFFWKIMPCQFLSIFIILISTLQALESAKPPEKYSSADSMVAMTLKIF